MQSLLPEYIDPAQKAKLGCEITGEWPVSRLERLRDLVRADSGMITATLSIGQEDRLRFIRGQVSATLQVTCQRCMQPMELPLVADVSLALITDETQADRLPEGYEPLLVEEGKMHLPGILEEELLLAMPLVAMHDYDCSDYLQQQKQRQEKDQDRLKAEKAKENPFAVLKDLL